MPDVRPFHRATHPDAGPASRAIALCRALVAARDETACRGFALDAVAACRALAGVDLDAFFDRLLTEFAQDPASRSVVVPRRELFHRLNGVPGGTAVLVDLRGQVLRRLRAAPALAAVEADLVYLLRAWFHRGFLELRRIDWRTPAAVLERLMHYEAVHRMNGWDDLRRRLQADRRCYAFFHPAMPDEPLIFIEGALTRGMSARVTPLLDPDGPILDPATCDAAVFFSISSCQDGLRGIPFGNLLIREVVDDLRRRLPQLQTFATLSPIPGFRSWLARTEVPAELRDRLTASDWKGDGRVRRDLTALCAYYLRYVKQGQEPADPVARFHLANGARLERVNWLADPSPAGLERSAGLMANYLYRLPDLDRNHDAYASAGSVVASRRVEWLAQDARARYY